MKIKNMNLVAGSQFLGSINTSKQGIKFCFTVSSLVSALAPTLKTIDELREKIINEQHEKDKDGNKIFIDKEKKYIMLSADGQKAMAELMDLESEVNFTPISLDALEAAGVKEYPANIELIKWLIKE